MTLRATREQPQRPRGRWLRFFAPTRQWIEAKVLQYGRMQFDFAGRCRKPGLIVFAEGGAVDVIGVLLGRLRQGHAQLREGVIQYIVERRPGELFFITELQMLRGLDSKKRAKNTDAPSGVEVLVVLGGAIGEHFHEP